jgi:hypothetical protein
MCRQVVNETVGVFLVVILPLLLHGSRTEIIARRSESEIPRTNSDPIRGNLKRNIIDKANDFHSESFNKSDKSKGVERQK